MKKASEQLKAALDSIATLNMERALRCVRDVKDKEAFARYADEVERIEAVSYTHLTLPTIGG